MKRTATALLILSLLGAPLAMAGPPSHRHDGHHGRHAAYHHPHKGHVHHRYEKSHHWRRGDRLPKVYHSHWRVIHDYRAHRLRRPPRDCHWVRIGNDVVLASIATGLILEVLHGHLH